MARGKDDRRLLCEAPDGPFRQKMPVTFSAALPRVVNGYGNAFRPGQSLGRRDHVVRWPTPDRSDWIDRDVHASLPDELEVREAETVIRQYGFRPATLDVATAIHCCNTGNAEAISSGMRVGLPVV
jgi:hypothetical protein